MESQNPPKTVIVEVGEHVNEVERPPHPSQEEVSASGNTAETRSAPTVEKIAEKECKPSVAECHPTDTSAASPSQGTKHMTRNENVPVSVHDAPTTTMDVPTQDTQNTDVKQGNAEEVNYTSPIKIIIGEGT